jgi:very-short-patch-repair endonuclease/flagellar biosynthesis GTPase FlhF
MDANTNIARQMNKARQELLDLGLRNPLLNYRTSKARGLEIIDEKPSEVFRLLVLEKRKMTFVETTGDQRETQPSISLAKSSNGRPGREPALAPGEKTGHQRDSRLQTPYLDKQLQDRLLHSYTAARTYIEEQGVNILYMAIGMLNWYEADQSKDRRQAPLLLIPVRLERSHAKERFTVAFTEDDIGFNISLAAKMKQDFAITLPVFDDEDFQLEPYFMKISDAIAGQPRWSVDEESIVIGFFSFGKFLMYRDLDIDHWPEHTKPLEHPVITALLQSGFQEPHSGIAEDAHLDTYLKWEDSNFIKDADSSQIMAIMDANQGRNLVIQGPPGTGKSQTITNLIAEAIGCGRKVLFVSEKMAALEVVKRRLDEVGLGVACLELHSHKTNKKLLLNELAHTLDLGKPIYAPNPHTSILNKLRERLNTHSHTINAEVGSYGVSAYEAMGHVAGYQLKYKQMPMPKINMDAMKTWTADRFNEGGLLIEELQSVVKSIGIPKQHPFWGSKRQVIMPYELDELGQMLQSMAETSCKFREQCTSLSDRTHFPELVRDSDARLLIKLLTRALEAPTATAHATLHSEKWITAKSSLDELTKAGERYSQIRGQYAELLIPDAWEQDLGESRQVLVSTQTKWWRFLSGSYRRTKNKIRALFRDPQGREINYLQIIDILAEARYCKRTISEHESLAKELYSASWEAIHTDWQDIARLNQWAYGLHKDLVNQTFPAWAVDYIAEITREAGLPKLLGDFKMSYDLYVRGSNELEEWLEFAGDTRFGNEQGLLEQPFTARFELISEWSKHIKDIQPLISYNQLAKMCNDNGLALFVDLSEDWEKSGELLVDCYRLNWYQMISSQAFHEQLPLSQFEGSRHEQAIAKFREFDVETTHTNRFKLAEAHWSQLPKQQDATGQLGILKREFEKKSRHLPIRQLMLKAGHAIQAIKPVFMMGPLSIATFVPPGSLEFDLVIFDEASQVKPVDAFGAIIRGKQTIVVGDSKQMPPTDLFNSLSRDDESEEDGVGDMESILGLFVGQNAPQRMLRWHYRSRHESLITVSNHEFYDNKLIVFPSPDAEKNDSGLIYHHLPETAYDRGRSRTNKLEAQAVAAAVMEHARSKPSLTLGVAAFSMAQMQAIMDELELMRRANPANEQFFSNHTHEPFFVKNLENVQGDERDVILISIGYGKTTEGYLAMDFGLLNREGGERRLNVLITRARIRCEVFTNLKPADIDLDRSNARGVKALKTFLTYAESGHMDIPVATGKDFDSPFEQAVYDALTGEGYNVAKQIGSAGFFIDLAIVDKDVPGRFVIGIECDGAAYHSARSARDRDRLRQSVLEGLGWSIHRIWSVDWFRHPEQELKRTVEAIEKAKLQTGQDTKLNLLKVAERDEREGKERVQPEIQRDASESDELAKESGISKYECAQLTIAWDGQEFHMLPVYQLANWVREVVAMESPVHKSEVVKRIGDAAGIKRMGARIQMALDEAIDHLVLQSVLSIKDEFLWIHGMEAPVIRDRRDLPNKKIELVSPQEIALAIMKVTIDSYGIERSLIVGAAVHMLGFFRITDDLKEAIEWVLESLLVRELLVDRDNQVFVA